MSKLIQNLINKYAIFSRNANIYHNLSSVKITNLLHKENSGQFVNNGISIYDVYGNS